MTELVLALGGAAIATLCVGIHALHRARRLLLHATARTDRERRRWSRVLAEAAAANQTLTDELARQRDQLAALEMRSGGVGRGQGTPRTFGGV